MIFTPLESGVKGEREIFWTGNEKRGKSVKLSAGYGNGDQQLSCLKFSSALVSALQCWVLYHSQRRVEVVKTYKLMVYNLHNRVVSCWRRSRITELNQFGFVSLFVTGAALWLVATATPPPEISSAEQQQKHAVGLKVVLLAVFRRMFFVCLFFFPQQNYFDESFV